MASDSDAGERERAAELVITAIADGKEPEAAALRATMTALTRFVRRSFPGLEAEDVVQVVMVRMWALGAELDRRAIESAWGYLVGACRYAALDVFKAHKRFAEVQTRYGAKHTRELDDDAIAALLERTATHEQVSRAFQLAIAAGDELAVPVVTIWLDLADELGRAPSLREVEPLVDVSHVSVSAALRRFGAYLSAAAGQPPA